MDIERIRQDVYEAMLDHEPAGQLMLDQLVLMTRHHSIRLIVALMNEDEHLLAITNHLGVVAGYKLRLGAYERLVQERDERRARVAMQNTSNPAAVALDL